MLVEEGNGSSGIQMGSLKPSWVKQVDDIEQIIGDIKNGMQILLKLHAERMGAVFGSNLDRQEERIEKETALITQKFRTAETALQTIGRATRGETVGANVQRSLAQRLQELSVQFRQSQRKYLAEVQAQKSGGLVVPEKFGIDFDESAFLKTTSAGMSSSSQQQSMMMDDLTSAVQSRDQEIVKIAQSIEELGNIFKELAVLVIDQGTILDRIDYNMEAVVEHTKTGIKQLERAERTQKNARPLRCILCLSFTVFILLTILIIKHRPRRGWF
jgi:syntaxin 16